MNGFLDNVLRGLISFSTGIFILLGVGVLLYLRKLILSLAEWNKSVFGLERNIAGRKLISASTGLTLLILLIVGEFLLVTIIGPQMPLGSVASLATVNPLVTPTTTLSPDETQQFSVQTTPTISQEALQSECEEGVLEITSPDNGERVSGIVEIIGTVNVEDFGYYKYEYSTTGTINWITIAAEDQLKLNENLGNWNTSELIPGPYLLQVVPLNNIGETLPSCIIGVEVISEE
jgi:hypothetical protein